MQSVPYHLNAGTSFTVVSFFLYMYNFNCQSNSCILKFCFYCIISMILLLLYRQTCQFYYLPHCKIKLFSIGYEALPDLLSLNLLSLYCIGVFFVGVGFFFALPLYIEIFLLCRITLIFAIVYIVLPWTLLLCHCLHCIALDFVALPLITLYCIVFCFFSSEYQSHYLLIHVCLFVCLFGVFVPLKYMINTTRHRS